MTRNSIRLIVACVLVLTLAGVCLWFIPFSSAYVDQRVKQSFKEATGLDLRFDALVFYLAQRRFILREVSVFDPATSETLTGANRIETELGVDWSKLDLNSVESIKIAKPQALSFNQTRKGIVPSENLARLLRVGENGKSKEPGGKKSDGLGIDTVTISDVAIHVNDATTSRTLAEIDRAEIIGSWQGSDEFDFLAKGLLKLADTNEFTSWRGRIARKPEAPGIEFFTQVEELIGRLRLDEELPLALSGHKVSLGGMFLPAVEETDTLRAEIKLAAAEFVVVNRQTYRSLKATNLHISTNVAFEQEKKLLQLASLNASALGLTLKGNGTLNLRTPYPYDARIDELGLPQESVQRLQNFFPMLKQVLDYRKGKVVATGTLKGTLREPLPETLQAALNMQGVELAVAQLPFPLRELNGTVFFDGQTLSTKRLSGKFGESALVLAGQLLSEQPQGLLQQRPSRLRLEWNLDGQSDDVLALITHTEPKAIKGLTTAGAVVSTGTLTTDFGTSPSLELAARNLKAQGSAELKKFEIDHPSFPSPLKNVNGTISLSNQSLDLQKLSGEFLRSSATLTGSVKGERWFWDKPQADLHIQTDLNLAQVAPEIRQRMKGDFELPPLKGQAAAEIKLIGGLSKPESLVYTGQLNLKSFETTLDVPVVHGRITKASGAITLEKDSLGFKDLRFAIGDVDYRFTGEMKRAELKVEGSVRGPLEQLKKAQAPLLDRFDVGGNIEIKDSFHLVLPEPERAKALADKRFPPILSFIDGAKSVNDRSLDELVALGRMTRSQNGTVVMRDADFTYLTLPQKIENLNGTLQLVREGLRAEGLNGTIGGYPARLGMNIIFSLDGHRHSVFEINAPQANLTPWYSKWPKLPEHLRYKKWPAMKNPILKATMRVVVNTGKTEIRKYKVDRHVVTLDYENWRGGNKLLYLRDVNLDGYRGHFDIAGKLTFVRDGGPVVWDTHVRTNQVELGLFLRDFTRKEPFISGRMNLEMDLRGQNVDKGTYQGMGKALINEPQFRKGNPAVVQFMRVARFISLNDLVFPEAHGDFIVRNGYVQTNRVTMGNEAIEVAARGRVWMETLKLDLEVFIKPLSAIQRTPLIGKIFDKAVDIAASSLLKFDVSGTAGNPTVVPIPVSADLLGELRDLF